MNAVPHSEWPVQLPRPFPRTFTPPSRWFQNTGSRPFPRPPARLAENWQSWPELCVRIHELPEDVSTSMVWEQLHMHGEIVLIEIYEPRHSTGMSARIKFCPPPKQSFWDFEDFVFHHDDTTRYPNGVPAIVKPDTKPPEDWMLSTINGQRSYARKTSIHLHGVRLGSTTGPRQFTIAESWDHEPPHPEFKLEIDVHEKKVSIYFHTRTNESLRSYKIRIDASQLRRLYRTRHSDGHQTFIVSLDFPPQYFWRRIDISATMTNERMWGDSDTWHRASCMADSFANPIMCPVSVRDNVDESGYVSLGRWTTCQFVIQHDQPEKMAYLKEALEDLNIRMQDVNDFEVLSKGKSPLWKQLDCSVVEGGNAMEMLETWSDVVHLPFEVRYQLEVCISRGVLNEHNISRELLEKLASTQPAKVQECLEHLADRGKPVYDASAIFADIDAAENPQYRRIPDYCYLVRKAVVTPTTMYLNSPSFETSNRVIREYSHVADRFLKVQFVEEGEAGRLRATAGQNNDEIWKRVFRTLNNGIQIGERLYEFLAFGNSQLRECGAYFFCPTDHLSCDDIRSWAGDFTHIKVIAKYAARLGQCFSTTRILRGIPSPTIRTIPDIERNGYCFSDGVGKISPFLAEFIAAEIPGNEGERPTAFQFRMGGSKGVLVVSADAKDKEVHIRPSQEKFKAQFNGLEIIRCARPATATLNRQTITILSDLDVPDAAFISLLEQQLRQYDASVTDNGVAIELLTKFVDQNQTALKIAELIRSGFRSKIHQDPFVLNIFRLWRSWSLKLLKEKARIHVEQSAFVLGCTDETGTLRGHSIETEGSRMKSPESLPQIFLQTVDPTTGKMFVLEGLCMVGRNPSLHPGDIRVVLAVDNPKLRHIRDVVVFPSTGDRPVPSMLSGGDLDGDDFFVIWDQTLIPRIWNWRPMDFSTAQPLETTGDVKSLDLQKFFVEYIMNDILPLIAIAHLAWADDRKPRSDMCLQLAQLHSHAVDYPKTGKLVSWDKRKMWPKRWPHFMEKDSRRSYDSFQVLGRLYDNVTKDKIAFKPDWDHAFDKRVLERYNFDPDMLEKAKGIKVQHDQAVRRILMQLNLKTEFELWTGFAMSKPIIGTDYKRQEVLGQELETLKLRFRGLCEEAAGGSQADKIDPFVAAMYKVTEIETTEALRQTDDEFSDDEDWASEVESLPVEQQMPLVTFPWLFPEVMVRLALGDEWVQKKPWFASSGGGTQQRANHTQS